MIDIIIIISSSSSNVIIIAIIIIIVIIIASWSEYHNIQNKHTNTPESEKTANTWES